MQGKAREMLTWKGGSESSDRLNLRRLHILGRERFWPTTLVFKSLKEKIRSYAN